jgi:DNA-binding transcriptional LysR family regulator
MSTITKSDTWLGVELRHLAALEAIAEEGSFGRAAERLGYTQSAVSQQIAVLERIVGERLLERPGGPRPVTLTEAGNLLLRHAEAIVARLEAAQADFAALRAGEAGTVRVGTYQSIGARVLPAVMQRYLAEWPQVQIELSEPGVDRELYEAIERGELDLAFCGLPVPTGPYEALELMTDPYVLLVPADSPLTAREAARLTDLNELPVISSLSCPGRHAAEQALREQGHEPNFVFRSDDNGTVQGLVAAGFGVALVPLLTVAPGDERVRVLRVEPPLPRRRIAVVWHEDRHRSAAARAFVDLAVEVSAEIGTSLSEP